MDDQVNLTVKKYIDAIPENKEKREKISLKTL